MVCDYDDAGQAAWAESAGIDVLRGERRLDGPGRVVVGERVLSTEHVVIATGSDPVVPPVPGLRELDGVWTNREATGLTEVPRRLLVLGGGPVGVEMAQAVARLGGSVAVVEGMDHVLPREPRALGDALGEALARDGVELCFGQHASAARLEDGEYVLEFPEREPLRGDRLLVATGRRPRVTGIGLETVGVEPGRTGIEVDARMSAGDGLWAIGDVTGIWPLTYVGKYQGRIAAANILGHREADHGAVRVSFQAAGGARSGRPRPRVSATADARRRPAHGDLHARVRRRRVPDARLRRRAHHRRLRPRPRGRRVAAAGDARDPRRRPARRHARRDPAVPDVLGGVPARPP